MENVINSKKLNKKSNLIGRKGESGSHLSPLIKTQQAKISVARFTGNTDCANFYTDAYLFRPCQYRESDTDARFSRHFHENTLGRIFVSSIVVSLVFPSSKINPALQKETSFPLVSIRTFKRNTTFRENSFKFKIDRSCANWNSCTNIESMM